MRETFQDVLLILSKIKMYRMEKGEIMSEVLKKAKNLISNLKIDLDILHK
jgi:hypothetical protein